MLLFFVILSVLSIYLLYIIYVCVFIIVGGVLSVIMYALMMDEITKETAKTDIGSKIWQGRQKINTPLWMNDAALITDN